MHDKRQEATVSPDAEAFYVQALDLLMASDIPFLVGGTFAVNAYTGIDRATKDLDIFCKANEYPRILTYFKDAGYETQIEDERWLAKVIQGEHFIDIIFNSTIAVTPITDEWFVQSRAAAIFDREVRLPSPTELIWSKVFIQDRYKYDGSDIAHLILTHSADIDWKRLLSYMEQYWEVLFLQVLNFRFIYPSERNAIPQWLLDELTQRLERQKDLPLPEKKVCRGRLFSRSDYVHDIHALGFADIVGEANERI
jgi:hypothetical protein